MLGAESAGLPPSQSPQSLLPPTDASLWLDGVAESCQPRGCHSGTVHWRPLGRWVFFPSGIVVVSPPWLPTPLTGLDLWQLGWEVSKTGTDTNWFYSLIAIAALRRSKYLPRRACFPGLPRGVMNMRGHSHSSLAYRDSLSVIAQPQIWALLLVPSSVLPRRLAPSLSLVVIRVHILAYSGFTFNFVSINISL